MSPFAYLAQRAARSGVPRTLYVLGVTVAMATAWLAMDQGRTDRMVRDLVDLARSAQAAEAAAISSPSLRGRRLQDALPTAAPVVLPTLAPVALPTLAPVALPTLAPVVLPTAAPVVLPTAAPVALSTAAPVEPAVADDVTTTGMPVDRAVDDSGLTNGAAASDVATSKGETDDIQQTLKKAQAINEQSRMGVIGHLVAQLIYGAIFWSLVGQHYPEVDARKPTDEAKEHQRKNEVSACFDGMSNGQCTNCLLTWFCPYPRAALTFDKTGVLSYWPALCLMAFFPFCTVCYGNACTDMNQRLGGKKRGCFMSCLCTWFCMNCVIYQDAVALDMTTGAVTGCCGVEQPADEGDASDSD